jgi:hypothetical protein
MDNEKLTKLLSSDQIYADYLYNQFYIFKAIEQKIMNFPDKFALLMKPYRSDEVQKDLSNLQYTSLKICRAVANYSNHVVHHKFKLDELQVEVKKLYSGIIYVDGPGNLYHFIDKDKAIELIGPDEELNSILDDVYEELKLRYFY